MLQSKQTGLITELQCMTYLYQLGYQVSVPYGENQRYDLIADINGKLIRLQCKSSSLSDDETYITFRCVSTRTNSNEAIRRKYTPDEIDYFATFYNNQCYLVPVTECSTTKNLRFVPPKNGQTKGISFATDYTAEKQIEKILKSE